MPSPPGPPAASTATVLALHAVRLCGMASTAQVAQRFRLPFEQAEEVLLDDEALGFVRRVGFADLQGWALTDAGRVEDERRLAQELDAAGARPTVQTALADFESLNGRFLTAVTDWQLRPQPWDRMAVNDHTDHRWDYRVIAELERLGPRLATVCEPLAHALARFDGYPQRYAAAMARVVAGERSWVDRVGVDSAHRVWLELHEDLVSTLGVQRGEEVSPR